MLQHDEPLDYVVATGTAYTVRDFVQFCFEYVGLDWQKYVRFDERYLRPTEVDALVGNPSRARSTLPWKARVFAPGLAEIMVKDSLRPLSPRLSTPKSANILSNAR
jgi:GDPmannose 4,6-dehydratase